MIDARNCALRRQEEEKIFLSRNKEGEGEGHCVSKLGFTLTFPENQDALSEK